MPSYSIRCNQCSNRNCNIEKQWQKLNNRNIARPHQSTIKNHTFFAKHWDCDRIDAILYCISIVFVEARRLPCRWVFFHFYTIQTKPFRMRTFLNFEFWFFEYWIFGALHVFYCFSNDTNRNGLRWSETEKSIFITHWALCIVFCLIHMNGWKHVRTCVQQDWQNVRKSRVFTLLLVFVSANRHFTLFTQLFYSVREYFWRNYSNKMEGQRKESEISP